VSDDAIRDIRGSLPTFGAEVTKRMMRKLSLGICGLLLGACALGTDDDVAQTDQDIVRGHRENGYPQVVAVRINGFTGWTLCSGTYVSERVVVTAAHCLRNDAIPGQTFVYHGKDYLTDVESLPAIPAPGERSKWARAESVVANPSYDASVNYPDMAVLLLDRELPFKPLPLLRQSVSDGTRYGTIVGWGGKRALTADISQVEGAGIKRSATVRLLGSPTEADYHEDDPNPGMLDPEIRADLLKTDGRAPRANTCAGDSGGPLLVERRGREYLAGVGMWTGLFCEDYSIFTRIDPFLDFLDGQIERAGEADIIPRLECVEETASGLVAHFGYTNDNGVTVKIPYGSKNDFDRDRTRERPSSFAPGDNPYAFGVPFTAGQSLTWKLNPPGGPTTVVRADASSPRCDSGSPELVCSAKCQAALGAECADGGASYGSCVTSCRADIDIYGYYGCGAEISAFYACTGELSSDASNWDCSVPGFPPSPMPPACDEPLNALLTCLGY
jgi:secreted trypsin-like serine protease